MKTENDKMDELFNELHGQWDTEEPELGHQQRFLAKLEGKKEKKKGFSYRLALPFAAAILIMLGIFITYEQQPANENPLANVSPQVKETHTYFTTIIEKELAKVEKENAPETKQLIKDALYRMEKLEKDYIKLTEELSRNGENKKIIHAMITNLQTRISFLEEVLTQIENIKKLKEQYHENKTV